jgi:hypothetical protein
MASTLYPTPTTCPISGAPAMQQPTGGLRREIISPGVGGSYAITGRVDAILEHRPLRDPERKLLAGWIAERHRGGEACPLITGNVLDNVLGKRS